MSLFTPTGEQIRYGVEPPPEVLRLVRAEHPNFGLRFSPFTKCWAIIWAWDEKDPRWRHIQEGRRPSSDAHDIVCDLPEDCPVESAASYIRAHCRVNPDSRAWEGVVAQQERSNRVYQMAIEARALDDVNNRIELSARNSTLRPLFGDGSDSDVTHEFEVEPIGADELRHMTDSG